MLADPGTCAFNSIRRDARRIGTHVGDQAGCALVADFHAFIQALRHAHRAAHIEPQLAGCIALQLAGNKRSKRTALPLLRSHRCKRPRRLLKSSQCRIHRLLVGQRVRDELILAVLVLAVRHAGRFAVDADKLGLEALVGLPLGVKQRLESPILNRLETRNLAFALHNQAHSNGLHAASRESPANLVPQQWRNLIADQPVEHTARLLRVHEILVDVAGVLECILHGLLGDLIKGYAADLFPFFGIRAKLQREVCRDRFAFAVRVRRKEDLVSLARPAFFN